MIGIIGGTGLYRMEALRVTETREVSTPFGPPSAALVLGELGGREVAFLARHGLHHDLLPGEKEIIEFTQAQGANFHCQPTGRQLTHTQMLDWLTDHLPARGLCSVRDGGCP